MAKWSVSKYTKIPGGGLLAPQLMRDGVPVLSLHRTANRETRRRGNGYRFSLTQAEAVKIGRRIVDALNEMEKSE